MSNIAPLANRAAVSEPQNHIPFVRPLYGSHPWRIVYGNGDMAAVFDAKNNTLFECKRDIAEHIIRTWGDYLRAIHAAADFKFLLATMQCSLRQIDRTPRVDEMIRMVDLALGSKSNGED